MKHLANKHSALRISTADYCLASTQLVPCTHTPLMGCVQCMVLENYLVVLRKSKGSL